jgi:chromosome segregation ATPase
MMVDSIQLETKSTTSISNDSITDSINSVLSQTNNEINNDCTFTNKKRNKRTVSNDNEDANLKKKRSNIEIKEISEAERLINIMMERLDNLEEENSHLSGLNNVISRELKEVKNNYIKLNAKHTSLVKIVEALKKDKGKIEQDLSSLDQRVTNANNDEMTGVFNNINHSTSKSFADLFKGNSDKSVSEPMADIINTFNDYNKQKRGRENNVIIFGMNHVNKD